MVNRNQIAILSSTPHILRSWIQELPEDLLNCNTGCDTFSPFDVVGHLIHGELTDWIPRLYLILEYGIERPFEPIDRFAMYEASQGKSISTLLDEFADLRRTNLETLTSLNLSAEDLVREGMHPELGKVTVSQLITTWAVHDLNHINQIARTIAFRYREDVGPWRAYLSILPAG